MKSTAARGLCAVLGLCFSLWFWLQTMGIAVPTAALPTETTKLPILMYHHILKDESTHNKYTISPQDFEADLAYLQSEGYTCILMSDLIRYTQAGVPLPKKPVMITFDDGYESFYAYAYPLLKQYDAKAVFSIVGTYTDQYSKTSDHHINYSHCTWSQLLEMQNSGMVEIQNHSYNLHKNTGSRMGSKPKAGESKAAYTQMLTDDLCKVQNTALQYLGKMPTAFAYPFGYVHPETLRVLKEMGFLGALTCEEKLNYLTGDPEELFHLRRVNRPHGTTAQQLLQAMDV